MKLEKIIEVQQPNTYKQLNKIRKQNSKNKKSRRGKKEDLSFSDVIELMQQDSYYRGRGGSIKQRTWGNRLS